MSSQIAENRLEMCDRRVDQGEDSSRPHYEKLDTVYISKTAICKFDYYP